MSESPKVVVERFDTSSLIQIWLDGFTSGASTAWMNANGGDAADADMAGDILAQRMVNDPAAMEEVRREVMERLTSVFGSAKTLTMAPTKGDG